MTPHMLFIFGILVWTLKYDMCVLEIYLAATPFGFAPFFSLNIVGIGAEEKPRINPLWLEQQIL